MLSTDLINSKGSKEFSTIYIASKNKSSGVTSMAQIKKPKLRLTNKQELLVKYGYKSIDQLNFENECTKDK